MVNTHKKVVDTKQELSHSRASRKRRAETVKCSEKWWTKRVFKKSNFENSFCLLSHLRRKTGAKENAIRFSVIKYLVNGLDN